MCQKLNINFPFNLSSGENVRKYINLHIKNSEKNINIYKDGRVRFGVGTNNSLLF